MPLGTSPLSVVATPVPLPGRDSAPAPARRFGDSSPHAPAPADAMSLSGMMDMSLSAGTMERCLDPNLLDLNDLSLSANTMEAIARVSRDVHGQDGSPVNG